MAIWHKSVIGIEMDSQEIRAVELKGSKQKPSVMAWGSIKLPEGVVQEGRIADTTACSEYLKRLLKENGFKGKEVILGVNNQDVIVRFASFPKVPEDKVRNMIYFQAQEYIPVPMEEIELDYVVLGEKKTNDGEFIDVVLVGARKTMLNDFIAAFSGADLIISEIDSTMFALGRAALKESSNGTFTLAGFNHDIGNILIFIEGFLGMARTLSISQFFSSINGCNDPDSANAIADYLFGEIKTSLGYFRTQNREEINTLCVLGCAEKQDRVALRLSETTGLDVSVPKPYSEFENRIIKGREEPFKTSYYMAGIDLAMRGLGE